MSLTTRAHKDLTDLKADLIYRNKTVQIGLSTAALTANSTISDIFSSELLGAFGYARVNSSFSTSDGTYNFSTLEFTLPTITATFTARSGIWQWQSAFVALGGAYNASRAFNSAAVNPTTDRIALALHNLTNGDRLLFTHEALGTLPGGCDSTTRYYVKAVDANTIELYTDAALIQRVDITDTGSGTMYARYASGTIAAVVQESAPVTLLDGQSYTYTITLKESI